MWRLREVIAARGFEGSERSSIAGVASRHGEMVNPCADDRMSGCTVFGAQVHELLTSAERGVDDEQVRIVQLAPRREILRVRASSNAAPRSRRGLR